MPQRVMPAGKSRGIVLDSPVGRIRTDPGLSMIFRLTIPHGKMATVPAAPVEIYLAVDDCPRILKPVWRQRASGMVRRFTRRRPGRFRQRGFCLSRRSLPEG